MQITANSCYFYSLRLKLVVKLFIENLFAQAAHICQCTSKSMAMFIIFGVTLKPQTDSALFVNGRVWGKSKIPGSGGDWYFIGGNSENILHFGLAIARIGIFL